jgi:hypothetical protein
MDLCLGSVGYWSWIAVRITPTEGEWYEIIKATAEKAR